MSFIRDSAYSLGARVWMAVARGMCIVAVSRALGPAEYGAYALVLNTFVIAVLIGSLGLEPACTFTAGRRRDQVPQLVRNAVVLSLLLGMVAIALVVPAARLCRGWLFEERAVRLVVESTLFVPLAVLGNQLSGIVVGCGWFRYNAKVETFKWTLYLALSVVLVLVHGLSVRTGLLAFYTAIATAACLHVIVLYRRLDARNGPWLDRALAMTMLGYGARALGTSIMNLLNFRFDLYLVKYFRTPGEVGIYSLGMNLAEVLLYCARSVNVVLFSRVSANASRANDLTPLAARLLLAGITGVSAAILAFKDPIVIHVFGDQFAACSNVVTLLLPGILAQTLTLLLIADFLGKERLGIVLQSGLLCFVVMVGLDLWWIPRWGVLGAAAASALAYVAQAMLLVGRHASESRQGTARYLVLRRSDVMDVVGRFQAARRGGKA